MSVKKQGFSLMEIAIVLVAIALILSIVLVGKTMIRATQIQSILTDKDFYAKSVLSFRDKYQAFPGDMFTATNLWGTDSNCNTLAPITTPHPETCNGNADGRIVGNEMFRAWQQLADAGLIPGAFAGTSAAQGSLVAQGGVNVPESKVTNAGYILYYQAPLNNASETLYPGNYGHVIMFGQPVANYQTYMGPILTPAEALLLDSKIDDGAPSTGNVVTLLSTVSNCAYIVDGVVKYNTPDTNNDCNLLFVTGF